MNFKILSIDYGNKRTGLAVSDSLQLIAIGLPSINTKKLMNFLNSYIYEENIQKIVIGEPKNCKNIFSVFEKEIQSFIKIFCIFFPSVSIDRFDERFTTKIATKTLLCVKKKYRTNKYILDNISATLLLQSYLDKKKSIII